MKKKILLIGLILLSVFGLKAQTVLFSEDFETTDGSGWEVVFGDPVFTVDTVAGLNNKTKMLTNGDVKESIVLLKNPQFEGSFTLEFDDYPSFNLGGAVISYKDNKNFVCVLVSNSTRRVSVRQVVDGKWDGKFDIADGANGWPEWYDENFVSDSIGEEMAWAEGKPDMIHWKISVDADMGTVSVDVDGNSILKDVSVVLPSYTTRLGIYSWWCRHAIDNFKVSAPSVGVKNTAIQESLTIYPNPVVGKELVAANSLSGNLIVNIYSVNGAKMLSQNQLGGSEIRVNVSSLSAGIYFLNVINSNGENRNQRFIVK